MFLPVLVVWLHATNDWSTIKDDFFMYCYQYGSHQWSTFRFDNVPIRKLLLVLRLKWVFCRTFQLQPNHFTCAHNAHTVVLYTYNYKERKDVHDTQQKNKRKAYKSKCYHMLSFYRIHIFGSLQYNTCRILFLYMDLFK